MAGERFATAFGLFIYPLLMYMSIGVAIASEAVASEEEDGDGEESDEDCKCAGILCKLLAIWVLDLLLGCQQSVVLLPLTSMTYTPFCSIMNVPSNRKYGACIHKWASAGIPYGIPMLVGGGLIGVLVKVVLDLNTSNESEDDRNKINAGKILCCGVGVGAAIIAFVGLALFVIWVFGGLVIGIWFEFSSWEIFKDLGVFKIILAPSTPIAIRLAEILSLIMKAEIGGGEVVEGANVGDVAADLGYNPSSLNVPNTSGAQDVEMSINPGISPILQNVA